MNVNPFSYLIEKLKSKVSKSGDTMTGELEIYNSGDSIHINRSDSSTYSGWLKFSNANGLCGMFGAHNDKKPYFYDGNDFTQIALASDIFAEFKGEMGGDNNPSLDFNDYTTNGWYDNIGTNRAGTANAPHKSDNGYLLVVSNKSRTVYQFWFSCYQGNGVVFRKQHVGTWSAWTVIIS